jgi:hypothetical protein
MLAPSLPTTLVRAGSSALACQSCEHVVEAWQLPILEGPDCPLCGGPLELCVSYGLDVADLDSPWPDLPGVHAFRTRG